MAWFRRRRRAEGAPPTPAPPAPDLAEWAEQAIFVLMSHFEHLHDQVRALAERVDAMERSSASGVSSEELLAMRRETVHLVAELASNTAALRRDVTSLSSLTRQVALAQLPAPPGTASGDVDTGDTDDEAEEDADEEVASTRRDLVLDLTDGSWDAARAPAGRPNGANPTYGTNGSAPPSANGNGSHQDTPTQGEHDADATPSNGSRPRSGALHPDVAQPSGHAEPA